jgi:proteasome assembly chaperone (PAC2) family protein
MHDHTQRPGLLYRRGMDHIRRFYRPSLRSPRALVAWEGWNDACEAASGAATYLLEQQGDTEPFAAIEPEEFYDFQVRRPHVESTDGRTRRITWPVTQAHPLHVPGAPHDAVVVVGEEPSLRWKTYTRSLAQILTEADVEMVVTLGAFIGQVAHSRPVPIIGVATDPALIEELGLMTSRYEGPTGIVSVMIEACREVGIPAVSLWAAAPHYLAANPNPKAMLALLSTASAVMDMPVDLGELEEAAAEFEDKVDEAMADDDEFTGYVRRLEEHSATEPIDPERSDRLINEIESFLKER